MLFSALDFISFFRIQPEPPNVNLESTDFVYNYFEVVHSISPIYSCELDYCLKFNLTFQIWMFLYKKATELSPPLLHIHKNITYKSFDFIRKQWAFFVSIFSDNCTENNEYRNMLAFSNARGFSQINIHWNLKLVEEKQRLQDLDLDLLQYHHRSASSWCNVEVLRWTAIPNFAKKI